MDDVVFHTPWIGSMLSKRKTLPPGGAETQVWMLATALARKGLRVAIIAFGRPGELPSEVSGVRIVLRRPRRQPRSFLGKLLQEATIWPALWNAPARTIVHRGAGVELGLIGIYARLTRRRLVFASANISDFSYRTITTRRSILAMYKLGVRLADEIVVQTKEQVRLCHDVFAREATLIASIQPLAPLQKDLPEAFLWVGRLVTYKRPQEYVRLARAIPDARFWMLGVPVPHHHEEDRRVVEWVTREARDVPNLELLAPRTHGELATLWPHAVASVNTAAFEGMPNVLLEAWSRGVPALVLTHDPDGVVSKFGIGSFAAGSFDLFVAYARELWATRHDRAAITRRCRTYIQRHHAPEEVADNWRRAISGMPAAGSLVPDADDQARCAA